jgi:6-phosphofructokinase 2
MPPIVTLTMNPAIDKSANVDRVLAEHKLRCTDPHAEPGGGGINVSRAVANLGGESLALYTAGGLYGEQFQRLVDGAGYAHQPIAIAGQTRESFTVFEESTTLQYRFNLPGPTLNEAEWRHALATIRALDPAPQYLVASGSLPPGVPPDFYAQVAEAGKHTGARVIVDTSGEALCAAVRSGVFLIKPNLRELSQLAGRELEGEAEQEQVAQAIVDDGGCEVMVVSLGAAGVLFVTKNNRQRFRAPTVPIKSKVGAGDSTVAGIVLALVRGWDLAEAVRFGVAAGAAAVMTPGSQLCRRDDTERLYERIKGKG